MAQCACGQVAKPVDKPVDNLAGGRDSMPFKEINLFEMLAALVNGADALNARIEGLEHLTNHLIGLIEAPLTQEERIRRLREIKATL